MEQEILLLNKRIFVDRSPVLLDYRPDEDWQKVWDAKGGKWYCEKGWLIGAEPDNKGGILLSKQKFEKDVMFSFTMASVLPATRDLNAVYCVTWDDEINYLKKGYSVSQTCDACGFEDLSYFVQLFKKITGTTPKKYASEMK